MCWQYVCFWWEMQQLALLDPLIQTIAAVTWALVNVQLDRYTVYSLFYALSVNIILHNIYKCTWCTNVLCCANISAVLYFLCCGLTTDIWNTFISKIAASGVSTGGQIDV